MVEVVVCGALVGDDDGTVTCVVGVDRAAGETAAPDGWAEASGNVGAGAPEVAPIAAAATVAPVSRAIGTTHQRLIPPDRSTSAIVAAPRGQVVAPGSARPVRRSGVRQEVREQRPDQGVDLVTDGPDLLDRGRSPPT
jgi:hypothetical protein